MKLKSKNFYNFFRIIFGAVFIFSAITKFIDISSFNLALSKFNLLSETLVTLFTYLIPSIEFLLGLLLIVNFKTEIIAQLTTLLVGLFTAVVVSKIFEGEHLSCSCFGSLTENNIDSITVIRNIILISCGIIITVYYQKKYSVRFERNQSFLTAKRKYQSKYWADSIKITLIATLFFFLGTQLLIFSFENKELKNRLSLLSTDRDVLQPNDTARSFTALDINGTKTEFNFSNDENRKYLIYILSPQCEACKLNLPNWIYLTPILQTKNVKIVGISIDSLKSTKNYVEKHNLNFQVYSASNDEFKIHYKAFITPQTILIDNKGKVIKD